MQKKEHKNTEISERISKLIEALGIKPNAFALALGYKRSQTIYDIVNGKSAPSFDFFNKLAMSEYSEVLNIDWVLTGRGEILLTKTPKKVINSNDIFLITKMILFQNSKKGYQIPNTRQAKRASRRMSPMLP